MTDASSPSSLMRRFQSLPRAVRWLAFAVAFVALFRVWEMTVGTLAGEWGREADAIEARVATVRASAEVRERLRAMDDAIVALGPVAKPGRDNEGRAALGRAVVEVLKNPDYKVKDDSFDLSGGGEKLREDLSRGIVKVGNRISRMTCTVKFESSPEDAIAIISDFEQRDDIESVSKVRMTKSGNRQVKVNLTLEAWAEVRGRRAR